MRVVCRFLLHKFGYTVEGVGFFVSLRMGDAVEPERASFPTYSFRE